MIDNNFWLQRWQEPGDPAFHETTVQPLLKKYADQFDLHQQMTVFLPLCGKSHDIYWLAQQVDQVYGCELSTLAIERFFNHYQLKFEKTPLSDEHICYRAENISLISGDIFTLDMSLLPQFDLIYDRAALIALTAEHRDGYVDKLRHQLKESGHIFLITLDYDEQLDKPPFSINRQTVNTLFKSFKHIACLHDRTHQLAEQDHLFQRGIASVTYKVYKISK